MRKSAIRNRLMLAQNSSNDESKQDSSFSIKETIDISAERQFYQQWPKLLDGAKLGVSKI